MGIKSMDGYGAGVESGNLQEGINKFMLAALLGAALSMNVNAQNNARVGKNFADGINFDLGGTGQGGNLDGNGLGKFNSIPLNLNNYEPVFDDGEIEKNKSDFIELALKMGLNLYSLFPEGLDPGKYDELFRYPLDIIIAEAVKLARLHGCFYTEEQFGVVEMLCSFWNNGKLDLDENHSIDLSVFPGVDMNDLNLNDISFCDGGILIPYHDGKKYVMMKLLNFGFVRDTFFYSCIKRLEDFLNSRGSDAEFAAEDFGIDVEELKTLSGICENDTKSEASSPEEKQDLYDMWEAIHVASIEFGFTPRQERLLWACINGNLKFGHGYIYVPDVDGSLNAPGVCYAFSAGANVEELRQYKKNGCPVIYTGDVGILPWWVRYGLDGKMPEDGDSSPEDSIYNNELSPVIENNPGGYIYNEDDSSGIGDEEIIGINPDDESIYDLGGQSPINNPKEPVLGVA